MRRYSKNQWLLGLPVDLSRKIVAACLHSTLIMKESKLTALEAASNSSFQAEDRRLAAAIVLKLQWVPKPMSTYLWSCGIRDQAD